MLILWCMIALAALLLFLKMQTVMERQKEKKANKGKQATKAGSKQDNSPRKQ